MFPKLDCRRVSRKRSASRPLAVIENSCAGSASISRKKSSATATASNPGPRFAEVCRRRRKLKGALTFPGHSSQLTLDRCQHRSRRSVHGNRIAPHPFNRRLVTQSFFLIRQQRSAMEVDQCNPHPSTCGQVMHQHHRFAGPNHSLRCCSFFNPRQRHRGSRLASQSFRANLRFGNRDLCFGSHREHHPPLS